MRIYFLPTMNFRMVPDELNISVILDDTYLSLFVLNILKSILSLRKSFR